MKEERGGSFEDLTWCATGFDLNLYVCRDLTSERFGFDLQELRLSLVACKMEI